MSIDRNAFQDCTLLEGVTIPDSVASMDGSAFSGCISLEKITVGKNNNNYSSVDGVLFNKDKTVLMCYPAGKKEASYTIPNSVTEIGHYGFYRTTSLKSVVIGDGVTSINDSTFFTGCVSLEEITVEKNNKNYSSFNGVMFNKDLTKLIRYPAGKKGTSYTIPDSVTEISWFSFQGCTMLTSVKIPDSVTKIGDWAFTGCTSLTSMALPNITLIGELVFAGCTSLTSVTIPASVENICLQAFDGCTSLTSVMIPDSVMSISPYAFRGCPLTDVFYGGTKEQWNAIRIWPNNEELANAIIHFKNTGSTGVPVEINIPKPTGTNVPNISNVQVEVAQGSTAIDTIPITEDGFIDLSSVPDGKYSFTFSAKNCAPRAYSVTVASGTLNGLDDVVELHLYGDINGDGKINGTDVLKAKLLAKGGSTSDAYDRVVANVNKDSTVNGTDVLQLKLHAKGSKNLWQ